VSACRGGEAGVITTGAAEETASFSTTKVHGLLMPQRA
jgi:hypothetical protein